VQDVELILWARPSELGEPPTAATRAASASVRIDRVASVASVWGPPSAVGESSPNSSGEMTVDSRFADTMETPAGVVSVVQLEPPA
jgi:hypothetical protein